jgi:hypothetical protein
LKRKYFILFFLILLQFVSLLYIFNFISIKPFILIVTVISFIFMFEYMINDIRLNNPKRLNYYHFEPIQKLTTKRLNIKLLQNITIYSYYFSSMVFIFLNIIFIFLNKTWPFEIGITLAIIGFNVFAILIHILEDIYIVLIE